MKKIKILTLSDHPLMSSGVGLQTKVFIESMLKTGRYEFVSLAGAIKHSSKQPIITKEWNHDWKIFPVDNFGTKDTVRSFMHAHKPDIVWLMTDPRFWTWLWEMEDEIRANCSLVYYHVWDNYPAPVFNKKYYESNDCVVTISKVTSDIVREVAPSTKEIYIPHAVEPLVFSKSSPDEISRFKENNFKDKDVKYFFWNNRNARRKHPGTLAFWFKEYCDKNPEENIKLVMHTDPKDPCGTDLDQTIKHLEAEEQIMISRDKISQQNLALLYSGAIATINISDAEGFGLSTLESLSCETPIIVNMTGGLQEQVKDGESYYGVPIEPSSKCIIGSQQVPYIHEDRISKDSFHSALDEWLSKTSQERKEIGTAAREYVLEKYNVEKNAATWDKLLTELYETNGSWSERRNNKTWQVIEL